ncbi:MAG: sigma-70 family RNA polymerase sigma factor [Phycisphaerae bacterium]|nr:sigma-70 family RNA polymerase sigma factor [Phycisphaerae bacterium]
MLEGLKSSSDRSAWRTFDTRYRPLVMIVAKRLGLQEADAEDVAQETMAAFVEAYRQGRYERERGRLRDWLRGIACHKVRDFQRRRGRQEQLVADRTDATRFLNQIEDDHVKIVWDDEWSKGVLRQCLEEVRDEVAPRTFEAFKLFALQQWSAKRVASYLQVSEEIVYQSKSRILVRIRKLFPQMEKIW